MGDEPGPKLICFNHTGPNNMFGCEGTMDRAVSKHFANMIVSVFYLMVHTKVNHSILPHMETIHGYQEQ